MKYPCCSKCKQVSVKLRPVDGVEVELCIDHYREWVKQNGDETNGRIEK